jgi:hypothetical protein
MGVFAQHLVPRPSEGSGGVVSAGGIETIERVAPWSQAGVSFPAALKGTAVDWIRVGCFYPSDDAFFCIDYGTAQSARTTSGVGY